MGGPATTVDHGQTFGSGGEGPPRGGKSAGAGQRPAQGGAAANLAAGNRAQGVISGTLKNTLTGKAQQLEGAKATILGARLFLE